VTRRKFFFKVGAASTRRRGRGILNLVWGSVLALADPVWITLGEIISGSGEAINVFDDRTAQPQRFYRLQALPWGTATFD